MLKSEIIAIEGATRALKSKVAQTMPDNPVLSGWAAYSQCDEDGIIRECLHRIANNTPLTLTFVEVGCADGLENNTHLLLLEGFRGVWIDGSKEKIFDIDRSLGGTVFEKLWVHEANVSIESAGLLASRARRFLGVHSIDFLSLGNEGNGWHVMPALLTELSPKLICVKYNAKFPPPTHLVMRYNEHHSWVGNDYFGASLQAWVDATNAHKYSLVSCNLSGENAFFVSEDFMKGFSLYQPGQLYQPARCFLTDIPKEPPPSMLWAKQQVQVNGERYRFVTAHGFEIPPFKFAVHADSDRFISTGIAQTGVWEPFETRIFSRLCRPGDTVLDLGANIGWYSVLAAKLLGSTGSVLAFEPDATNARLLEINAAISDQHGIIQIFRTAVGDRETEALFYKSDFNLGDHRLFSDGSSREAQLVPVTRLDTVFSGRQHKLPDVVKSDTQGSEAKILKGAESLFSKGWRPIMILEFWPFGLTQSADDPMTLWRRAIELGYTVFEISEGNQSLMDIDEERLNILLAGDISPSAQGFLNLLCMPKTSPRIDCLVDMFQRTPLLT